MLIAGPHFGVPSNVREEIERIRSDSQKPLTQHAWEIRRKLEREDVKQAQLSAIARYDVILDASPWRAFARWHSLGFHDAERGAPGDDAPVGFAMFSTPEAEGAPALSRMEALRERWPWLFVRLSELAPQGLAVAGFSGEEALEWSRQLTSWWPEVPVLAEDEVAGALHGKHVHAASERLDAPLREPTLRDYLRALKVVAGQVRLVGEDHERPIEDIFVDMELVRRDGLEVKPERQERKREA
ncbi:MAG TPA: hypothetical protein VEZ71_07045, partial [Archangium sp.]|nr:hypothetical protein [Archangium sp.]